MKAYLDHNAYLMYAEDRDIIVADISSAAHKLQALHLELKEIKIYATVADVDTQYFHNAFLNDEEAFQDFKKYVTAHFTKGMTVTIYRNQIIVYYNDEEYYFNNHNIQIESVRILVQN